MLEYELSKNAFAVDEHPRRDEEVDVPGNSDKRRPEEKKGHPNPEPGST